MQGEAGGQADFRNVDLCTVALIFVCLQEEAVCLS